MGSIALCLCCAIPSAEPRAAVTDARLEGTLKDEDLALEATLTVRLPEKSWAEADLLDRRAAAEDLRSKGASFVVKGGRVVLIARGPGSFEVRYAQRVRLEDGSLTLYLPRAASTTLVLRAEGRPIELEAAPPACVIRKDNTFTVFPAGVEPLDLRVRPRREEVVRFRVAEELRAAVGTDSASLLCDVRFSVLSGELRRANVTVPEGLELVSVESKNLVEWRRSGRKLTLRFLRPEGAFGVRFAFDVAPRDGRWRLAPLAVEEASALAGTLVVEPAKETSVEVLEIKGLRRTGARAFSFSSPEGAVVCKSGREEPLVAVTENMTATLGGAAAEVALDVGISVERGTLFGLDAALPPRMRVLSVAGRALTGWSAREGLLSLSFTGLPAGVYALHLRAEVEADPRGRFELSPVSVENARRHSGRLRLAVKGRRRMVVVSSEKAYQGEGGEFKFHDARARVVAEAPALEAELSSTSVLLAVVSEEALRMALSAMLRCDRAPAYSTRLWLGPGVETEDLASRLVRSYDAGPDGLSIEFTEGLLAQEFIKGRFWKDLRGAEVAEVPLAGFEGTKKSRSFLIIRAEGDLDFSVGKSTLALTPCTPKALPRWGPRARGDDLVFKYSGSGGTLTVQPKARHAELRLESFAVVSFDAAAASTEIILSAEIRRAGVSELVFIFPPRAKNIAIESESLNRVEELPALADGSPRKRVILRGKRKGKVAFSARFQHVLEDGKVAFRGVTLEGAQGERGFIALAAEPEIDVQEDADERAGCALADWSALPRGRKRPENSLSLFSFANERPALTVRASYIQRKERVPAAVKELALTTIVDPKGRIVERARMSFQSKGRAQYLGVSLPERAVLWGTYVDGKPVRSSESEFGDVMVPIREKRSGEVELRYVRSEEFAGHLASPRLRVSSGRTEWKVFLPEEYKVLSTGGNMTLTQSPPLRPGWAFTAAFGRCVGKVLGFVWPVIHVVLKVLGVILVVAVIVVAGYFVLRLVWFRTGPAVKALLAVGAVLLVAFISIPTLMVGRDAPRFASLAKAGLKPLAEMHEPAPAASRPADEEGGKWFEKAKGDRFTHGPAGRRDAMQFRAKKPEPVTYEAGKAAVDRVRAPRKRLGADEKMRRRELAEKKESETRVDAYLPREAPAEEMVERPAIMDEASEAEDKLAEVETTARPARKRPKLRPPAKPMAPEEKARAREAYDAALWKAEELAKDGRFNEASRLAENALRARPDSREARSLFRRLSAAKEKPGGASRRGSVREEGRPSDTGVAGVMSAGGTIEVTGAAEGEEEALAGELAARASAAGAGPAARLAFVDASIYRKVLGGRAKGALPIVFDIPAGGVEYVFVKEFTGTTAPEVKLRCVRATASKAAWLIVLAVVGAAAAAFVRIRRLHHRDTETQGEKE